MSRVLIGVTGGIAAYKAVELVSTLRKRGDELKVIMTENATKFVSPVTFAGVGKCDVYVNAFEVQSGTIVHTTISQWADVMVVTPLSANTIAKLRFGIADNLLTMTALAFEGKKIAVPSMNTRMYDNPATVENLSVMKARGWMVIEPDVGHLADGEYGKGRYPQTEAIVLEIDRALRPHDLEGFNILVSAGPTREALDPVRYISNRSSGKMGYEIARAAWLRGATVKLISGPVCLPIPYGIETINVESAREMRNAVLEYLPWASIVIMSAAVADYRPTTFSERKIKKSEEEMHLSLARTDDILSEINEKKTEQHFIVAFAAETENLIANASEKMERKGVDVIVANDVSRKDIGFGSDFNEATILCKDGKVIHLERETKRSIAHKILDIVKSQRVKKS